MRWRIQSQLVILGLLSVTITGMAILIYATQIWGIGVSPDSVTYLDAGNNLYEQHALTSQGDVLTHYPPFYPILLAGTRLGTDSILTGARWLNVFLLGGNIVLVYLIVLRVTGAQHWSLAGAVLFLVVDSIIYIHLWAWTEALFILLTLAALLLLDLYLLRDNMSLLVGSAVFVSLATLTRYAGLFLIAAAAIMLLLDHRVPIRRRLVTSSVFAFISLLPASLWLINTSVAGDGVANRTIAFHAIGMERIEQGLRTVSGWFIPDRVAILLDRAGLLELMTGIGVMYVCMYVCHLEGSWHKSGQMGSQLLTIFSISLCAYVLFLLLSISTFDAHTPLDGRILSPIIPLLVTMGVSIIHRHQRPNNYLRFVLYISLVAVFLLNVRGTMSRVQSAHTSGLGYTAQSWASSELIGAIENYSPEVPIYSNGNDVIYFYTGRVVLRVPAKYSPNSMQENKRYVEEITEMSDALRRDSGILIYFSGIRRQYLPSENELEEALRLDEIYRTEEGMIYRLAP